MNKKVSLWISIALALVLCVATYLATSTALNKAYMEQISQLVGNPGVGGETSAYQDMYDKLSEIEKIVNGYFVGDIDPELLSDAVCSAYLAALGDKYTMYHTAEEMAEYLSTSEGNYVGIGVQVSYDAETQGIYIITVFPDSPAMEAGLLVGDVILQVEDIVCSEETYFQAVNAVKGESGTEVTLKVKKGDKIEDVTMTRRKVENVSVFYRTIDDTAVIEVLQFTQTTAADFRKALEQAKKDNVKHYVFDMRNNGGGDLNAIVEVLDMLLPKGTILTASDKNGTVIQTYSSTDKESLDAPMAVLINGNTASAAELFTAALRDYDKAVTVGTTTYGKGEMQSLITLPDGSGVRISTYFYNPPCGINYEGIGIIPDIEIELPEELANKYYLITDEEDVQLQKALEAVKNED
ncbi:MAG: S41 family peptidase [Clostridia bacterium]|nr:S41 family peptidase [Clostridia bacterium]